MRITLKNKQEPEATAWIRQILHFLCGSFLLHVHSKEYKLQRLVWHMKPASSTD